MWKNIHIQVLVFSNCFLKRFLLTVNNGVAEINQVFVCLFPPPRGDSTNFSFVRMSEVTGDCSSKSFS